MGIHVLRAMVVACLCLAFTGCGQWQTYKCVRDTVSRSEPYYSQADRDDSEALAWQACRERAAARGN